MGNEFKTSMMGELNFVLGQQIKQTPIGTMIHKQKYIKELLKKLSIDSSKSIDTPTAIAKKLDLDEKGKSVETKLYRGMIGSLLYLTTSRTDIVFSVGLCARFQGFILAGKALQERIFYWFLPGVLGNKEIELSGVVYS
nr:uncharacterized protein LOC117280867 [Nicotiana tomentosiformis]